MVEEYFNEKRWCYEMGLLMEMFGVDGRRVVVCKEDIPAIRFSVDLR